MKSNISTESGNLNKSRPRSMSGRFSSCFAFEEVLIAEDGAGIHGRDCPRLVCVRRIRQTGLGNHARFTLLTGIEGF